MANPWMSHLAKVWAKLKKKGGSYKQAMIEARIRMVHDRLADARHVDDLRILTRMLQRLVNMEPDEEEEIDEE